MLKHASICLTWLPLMHRCCCLPLSVLLQHYDCHHALVPALAGSKWVHISVRFGVVKVLQACSIMHTNEAWTLSLSMLATDGQCCEPIGAAYIHRKLAGLYAATCAAQARGRPAPRVMGFLGPQWQQGLCCCFIRQYHSANMAFGKCASASQSLYTADHSCPVCSHTHPVRSSNWWAEVRLHGLAMQWRPWLWLSCCRWLFKLSWLHAALKLACKRCCWPGVEFRQCWLAAGTDVEGLQCFCQSGKRCWQQG